MRFGRGRSLGPRGTDARGLTFLGLRSWSNYNSLCASFQPGLLFVAPPGQRSQLEGLIRIDIHAGCFKFANKGQFPSIAVKRNVEYPVDIRRLRHSLDH